MTRSFSHVLFLLAGHADAECVAGDLREEFSLRRREVGVAHAWWWYASQLARSVGWRLLKGAASTAVLLAPSAVAMFWLWSFLFDWLCVEPVPGFYPGNVASLLIGAMLSRQRLRGFALCALGVLGCAAVLEGSRAFPHLIAGVMALPAGMVLAQSRKAAV